MVYRTISAAAIALLCLAVGSATPASAATPVTLTIYGAGTLAAPFKQIATAFEQQNPDVVVHSEFGGSVMMSKRITDLQQHADVLAVADYSVIPKYLFGGDGKAVFADWYAGFAQNAITFVYTGKSKFAGQISPDNWYDLLGRPGVQIGRSNPDTDPSGYQTLQMLALAAKFYKSPDLEAKVLGNAPPENIRDTETELLAALQLGQIDYLAIYRSDALQHRLQYLELPAAINLSDAADAANYATAIAHTRNGDLSGKPIVYAVTIPNDADQPAWGQKYVAFLLSPAGQKLMADNGFGTVNPAYAVNVDKMPESLRPMVRPWPKN
jgi:molybdate/tungstate transport system substrate-binding protein